MVQQLQKVVRPPGGQRSKQQCGAAPEGGEQLQKVAQVAKHLQKVVQQLQKVVPGGQQQQMVVQQLQKVVEQLQKVVEQLQKVVQQRQGRGKEGAGGGGREKRGPPSCSRDEYMRRVMEEPPVLYSS